MARWHLRDHRDAPSTGTALALLATGLMAGVAAGTYLAHRFGGVSGISARMRRRMRLEHAGGQERTSGNSHDRSAHRGVDEGYDVFESEAYHEDESEPTSTAELEAAAMEAELEDEMDEDDLRDADMFDEEDVAMSEAGDADAFASADPELEDRVLTAFTNDPVLCERAIDIGAVSPATIELTGIVLTDAEYEHATVVTRGVPGVETVVNRLTVREQEVAEDRAARHYADGDPRFTESHWENDMVGTGRPRQGTSQDVGRHADPKLPLETRTLSESEALRDAADDVPPKRATGAAQPGRTDHNTDALG